MVKWYHRNYDERPSKTIDALVNMTIRLTYNHVLRGQIDRYTNPKTGFIQLEGLYVDANELYWALKLDDGLLVAGPIPTSSGVKPVVSSDRKVPKKRKRRNDQTDSSPDSR